VVNDDPVCSIACEGCTSLLPRPITRRKQESTGYTARARFGDNVKAFDISSALVLQHRKIGTNGEFGESVHAPIFRDRSKNSDGLSQSSGEECGDLGCMVFNTIGP
jgi:hypothetical protein